MENNDDSIKKRKKNVLLEAEEEEDNISTNSSTTSNTTTEDETSKNFRVARKNFKAKLNDRETKSINKTDPIKKSLKSNDKNIVNPNDGEWSITTKIASPQSLSNNDPMDIVVTIDEDNKIKQSRIAHYEEQMRKKTTEFAKAAAGVALAAAQLASSYSRIGLVDNDDSDNNVVDKAVSAAEAAAEAVRMIQRQQKLHCKKHDRQQQVDDESDTTSSDDNNVRNIRMKNHIIDAIPSNLPSKKRHNRHQCGEDMQVQYDNAQHYYHPPSPMALMQQQPPPPYPGPYYSFGSSEFPIAPYAQQTSPYFIPPPPNFMQQPFHYPPATPPYHPYNMPPPPPRFSPCQQDADDEEEYQNNNKRRISEQQYEDDTKQQRHDKEKSTPYEWRNVRQSLPPPQHTGRRRLHSSLEIATNQSPPPFSTKPPFDTSTKKRYFKYSNTPSPQPIKTTNQRRKKNAIPNNFKPIGKTAIAALYELCSKQHLNPKFIETSKQQKHKYKEFMFQVCVSDSILGFGRGGTKTAAKQDAARQALVYLLPGIRFDGNGIIVSVDTSVKSLDDNSANTNEEDTLLLTPLLTNQLAIIKDEQVVETTPDTKDESYYSSPRGASACSTLLHTMCQIKDDILQPPTYTYREVPFSAIDDNHKRRLYHNNARFSFECIATIIIKKDDTSTEQKQLNSPTNNKRKIIEADGINYTTKQSKNEKQKVLSAIGTGATKRDAKHVASANLLKLLYPVEDGSIVKVMAAAEEARERYTKQKKELQEKECWYKDIRIFLDIKLKE